MELQAGSGAAGPRHVSWPAGAAVEVSGLPAKVVRFDAEQDTIEVEYHGGSRQVLPVHRVRRACREGGRLTGNTVSRRETASTIAKQ